MRSLRLTFFSVVFTVSAMFFCGACYGQNLVSQGYVSAVGSPNFAVNIPVPNGFINVANGNLHMEIPLSSLPQRGALKLNERLVYDSRIWEIIAYNHHYWWPLNIVGSDLVTQASDGWRFVSGGDVGKISYSYASAYDNDCYDQWGNENTDEVYTQGITWTDPGGVAHTFDALMQSDDNNCTGTYTQSITGGYAADASGYYVSDDGSGNPLITDSSGTEVYPSIIDRFGNYWSKDANGNLIDDLGRTPVITTVNGNVTYYDVLAPNGPISNNGTRVRYTVTYEWISLNTSFNQQGVTEYQNNGNPPGSNHPNILTIQSIQLPDGSSYQFGYDSYGAMNSVTLPQGGTVQYGWTNYQDSYQNVNHWLQTSTTTDGSTTFTPYVISQCSSNGTGCQEAVNLHRASGDETVYTFTLNNGAWDTNTSIYSGAANSGVVKFTDSTTYTFSNACIYTQVCQGSQFITKAEEVQALPDAGISTTIQTGYAHPEDGRITSWGQWDYTPIGTALPATPTRSATFAYTGNDLTSETHYDSAGNVASSTTYTYTGTATATSGVVGHGTTNAGGPYLTSFTATNNSPATSYTVQNTYDDTGALLTSQDALLNPATTFHYDPTHTFVTEIDKPDTTNTLGTFHHVTKTSYDPNTGVVLTVDDENSVAHGQAYTVRYTYEPVAGRVGSITYPYDPAVSSQGGMVTYSYPSPNETDLSVAQTGTVSTITQNVVDGYGRPSSSTTGGVTSMKSYDGNGRPFQEWTPHTGSQSPTDGVTSTYYDALNHVRLVVNPDNTQRSTSYIGNVATATDELGHQKSTTHDAFGEVTSVTEADPTTGALDMVTNYQYDGLGNAICVEQHGNVSGTGCSSSPSSDFSSQWRVRRFFYNSLGQLRAASVPEHTSATQPGHNNCATPENGSFWTDCYTYDGNGNLLSKLDNLSSTVTYTYDALNRVTKEAGVSVNGVYLYDYGTNGTGHLYMEANNANAISAYSYDVTGKLIATTSCAPGNCPHSLRGALPSPATFRPPTYPTTYATYDLAGNVTSLTYPDGRVIQNNFDSANREQSVVYQQWGAQPVGTTYWSGTSYTPPGQLSGATLGNGVQVQAQFNSRLNLTALNYQSPSNNQTYFSKAYQWAQNGANLLVETNQTNGQLRQFGYDNLNRLISAQDVSSLGMQSTGTATVSGFEGSQQDCSDGGADPAQPTQPPRCTVVWDTGNISITVGSFTATASYFRFATATSLANALATQLNSGGSPVQATVSGSTITLTSIATGTAADYILSTVSGGAGDFTVSFNGGATGANSAMTGGQDGTPVPGGMNQQYTIDAWGNITHLGNAGTGFSQAATNQNQISGFGYDAKGRLANDGVFGYTYNGDDQLLSSTDGTTYAYDGARQRVAVTNSGGSYEYYYFAGTLIAVRNVASGTWTDLIYAAGERIAQVNGNISATPVYDLLDHVGAEVASVDANANTLATMDYAPFGQIYSGANGGDGFVFAGLLRDSGTGLDHADERQYSSITGRWTVPDPYDGSASVDNPQSLNRYAYVGNMPLRFTDPSGQDPFDDIYTISVYVFASGGEVDPLQDVFAGAMLLGDVALEVLDLFGADFFAPQFVGNTQAQKTGKVNRTLHRLNEVAQCASKVANKFSIAGVLDINEEAHPVLAAFSNAFLGNTFSGISDTITHVATGHIGAAYGDFALGGTRQGLPGGTASSKGLAGVVTETTVNVISKPTAILSGVTGIATDIAEEGLAGPVGWAKLGIDGAVYAASLAYCQAHIP